MIDINFTIKFPKTKRELKQFNKREIIEIQLGCLEKLESQYREYMDNETSVIIDKKRQIVKIPLCCETCKYIGPAAYHCHNKDSEKAHLNVLRQNVCENYLPNVGLLMFISRNCSKKFVKEI